MNLKRAVAMIFVVDALAAIVLIQQAIITRESIAKSITPPRIETLGSYAVEASWPGNDNDDIDLYVQNPKGDVVYFSNTSAGFMNLENDDIPDSSETVYSRSSGNHERVVIRSFIPGEYVVNVHVYAKNNRNPSPVVVKLWRLIGDDRLLKSQRLVLRTLGEEQTAFRFTVNPQGVVTNYSRLPKQLIFAGLQSPAAGGVTR